jgi:YHS domain-containing protein
MKRFAILLLFALLFAAACGQSKPAATAPPQAKLEMRTLDGADARPSVLDPPPVLTDEAPPPKPHDAVAAQNQIPLTEADEQLRARMPFAPAIGLDPVDGSKISIRATTPMFELKNHIYYFTSEANKQTFMANPAQFAKGIFAAH